MPWRTRHLRVKSAALTEAVEDQATVIKHCPGVVQVADIGTKTLDSVKLQELMKFILKFSMLEGQRTSEISAAVAFIMIPGAVAAKLPNPPNGPVHKDAVSGVVSMIQLVGMIQLIVFRYQL